METLLNKNLILTEDKFIWKILTPEESLRIYENKVFELYKVCKDGDSYVESLIESKKELDDCIYTNWLICIEVGSTKINTPTITVPQTNPDQAIRYNSGKLKWSLVDFDSLKDMVRVLMFGAEKYSPDNWKKGLPTKEVCESLLRHTFAYLEGEDNDPESNLSHLGHIMCNTMFLSWIAKHKPEFDNRKIE